jgi:hypothetical protein
VVCCCSCFVQLHWQSAVAEEVDVVCCCRCFSFQLHLPGELWCFGERLEDSEFEKGPLPLFIDRLRSVKKHLRCLRGANSYPDTRTHAHTHIHTYTYTHTHIRCVVSFHALRATLLIAHVCLRVGAKPSWQECSLLGHARCTVLRTVCCGQCIVSCPLWRLVGLCVGDRESRSSTTKYFQQTKDPQKLVKIRENSRIFMRARGFFLESRRYVKKNHRETPSHSIASYR